MINCIIVDDEPLACKLLVSYAEKLDNLNVLGAFTNPLEALSFMQTNQIDLVFLDIQMPELSGVQLAKIVDKKIKIIFTTAYPNYAVEGFELKALDYLVKPITLQRFLSATQRLQESEIKEDAKLLRDNIIHLFVKTEHRLQKVNLKDILFFKGMGDYVQINTLAHKVMTLENMKSFEQKLKNTSFVRVHKSYIVSIEKIEFIQNNRIKINDELIPIGKTYQDSFYNTLNQSNM